MPADNLTWDRFWADALAALQPAVLAVLSAALWYLAAWLKAKAVAVQQSEVRQAARETIEAAQSALFSAMRETWQTYVADLKAAAADGRLQPQEQEQARRKALAAFQARLSRDQTERLRALIGDVEAWASHELEALMPALKAEVERSNRSTAASSRRSGSASSNGSTKSTSANRRGA